MKNKISKNKKEKAIIKDFYKSLWREVDEKIFMPKDRFEKNVAKALRELSTPGPKLTKRGLNSDIKKYLGK